MDWAFSRCRGLLRSAGIVGQWNVLVDSKDLFCHEHACAHAKGGPKTQRISLVSPNHEGKKKKNNRSGEAPPEPLSSRLARFELREIKSGTKQMKAYW